MTMCGTTLMMYGIAGQCRHHHSSCHTPCEIKCRAPDSMWEKRLLRNVCVCQVDPIGISCFIHKKAFLEGEKGVNKLNLTLHSNI